MNPQRDRDCASCDLLKPLLNDDWMVPIAKSITEQATTDSDMVK